MYPSPWTDTKNWPATDSGRKSVELTYTKTLDARAGVTNDAVVVQNELIPLVPFVPAAPAAPRGPGMFTMTGFVQLILKSASSYFHIPAILIFGEDCFHTLATFIQTTDCFQTPETLIQILFATVP
jgi:hypothetical protein